MFKQNVLRCLVYLRILGLIFLFYLQESDCSNLYRALKGRRFSPLVLKRSYGVHNFFQAPTSVTSTLVPLKSLQDEDELETTYVSQLRDKRLLYCYADGNLALCSTNSAENVLNCAQFLPPGKTIEVHELKDGRLIVCQIAEDETEGEQYLNFLVDFELNTSKELDLLGLSIKCISFIDSQTILMGTTNGKLIQFDLEANKIVKLCALSTSATAKRLSKQTVLTEENDFQVLSEVEVSKGRPILCVDQNYSGGIFIVLDIENGYLSGLFDLEESELRRIQFYHYPDFKKIGFPISRVVYDSYSKLIFIAQYDGQSSPKVCDIDFRQLQLKSIHPQAASPKRRAFVFPNGNIAFLSNHVPQVQRDPMTEDLMHHSDSDKATSKDHASENASADDYGGIDLSLYTDVVCDNNGSDSEDPQPEHGLIEIQSFRIA